MLQGESRRRVWPVTFIFSFLAIAAVSLAVLSGCSDEEQVLGPVESLPYDTIFIVDVEDHRWEVTYGINELGLTRLFFAAAAVRIGSRFSIIRSSPCRVIRIIPIRTRFRLST